MSQSFVRTGFRLFLAIYVQATEISLALYNIKEGLSSIFIFDLVVPSKL